MFDAKYDMTEMTRVLEETVIVQACFTALLLCNCDPVNSYRYVISDHHSSGRVFDGIGAISGGSVSKVNFSFS